MLSPAQLEIRIKGLESYIVEDELAIAREQDERLLHQLQDQNASAERYESRVGLQFANDELATRAQESYTEEELVELESFLNKKGTLTIPLVTGHKVVVDDVERPVIFVGATELAEDGTNHGEMSTMLYLRDHIQAAKALMELYLQDPKAYEKEGVLARELLISGLHFMSTPDQLNRCNDVIARGTKAGQEDWPHISLWFDDLQGEKPNGWRNKQDTFQMLTEFAFDAIDRDFLDVDSLANAHKQFLGSAVPLLTAVGFPKYESSRSWEEFAANRTSVMSVETALLHTVTRIGADNPKIAFLKEIYEKHQDALGVTQGFGEHVEDMFDTGLREIGRRLPFESPDYEPESVKYREADIALTYVLMYGMPQLLAERHIPIGEAERPMTVEAIEDIVLESIESLADPETNGHARYNEDSYQRTNFHTHEVQLIVRAIKGLTKAKSGVVDLEQKQALRGKLTPQGKEAAWTHPLGQLSSWAAKREIASQDVGDEAAAKRYRTLATEYFNRALSLVTGKSHWTASLDDRGKYKLQHVPAFRLPECMIAYQASNDEHYIVPSPHTPLNWASAMMKLSAGLLKTATKKANQAQPLHR